MWQIFKNPFLRVRHAARAAAIQGLIPAIPMTSASVNVIHNENYGLLDNSPPSHILIPVYNNWHHDCPWRTPSYDPSPGLCAVHKTSCHKKNTRTSHTLPPQQTPYWYPSHTQRYSYTPCLSDTNAHTRDTAWHPGPFYLAA